MKAILSVASIPTGAAYGVHTLRASINACSRVVMGLNDGNRNERAGFAVFGPVFPGLTDSGVGIPYALRQSRIRRAERIKRAEKTSVSGLRGVPVAFSDCSGWPQPPCAPAEYESLF